MADVQDDDQWLYGDDTTEKQTADEHREYAEKTSTDEGETDKTKEIPAKDVNDDDDAAAAAAVTEETGDSIATDSVADKEAVSDAAAVSGDGDAAAAGEEEAGDGGDKAADAGEGESSDEDEFTVTIGELRKAAEVMTPAQQHQARFQPKAAPTTGLKDDDFNTAGKINSVPVAEFQYNEEDKPWRKPGTDLSDYFNYGFNEETWFKYCDRQKKMRVEESGTGLHSLGLNTGKHYGNLAGLEAKGNENSMGNNMMGGRKTNLDYVPSINKRNEKTGNIIQVMTADRREYSSKVVQPMQPNFMTGPPPGQHRYDDNMEFGGHGGYPGPGGPDNNGYYPPPGGYNQYNTPPPVNSYNNPPPGANWNNPPPPIVAPPPQMPPQGLPPPPHLNNHNGPPPPIQPRWGGDIPPPPSHQSTNSPPPPPSGGGSGPPPSYRDRDRDLESEDDRRRSRRHRRPSPSPVRSRHRSRSRSRSPGHKHKRKKSKRDRDD